MNRIVVSLLWMIAAFQIACTTSRVATPEPIGILPLPNYSIASEVPQKDTSFAVYKNEAAFSADYKATSSSARKPEFSGQVALAVSLAASSSLYFEKAMKGNSIIYIYLKSCEAASQSSCQTGRLFMATIPKVGNARSIEFLINDVTKGRVSL